MDYKVLPLGSLWNDGSFNIPSSVVDRYIKMASEYQLKALLFVLRNGGGASSADIARALGLPAGEVNELLDLWVTEGVLVADGEMADNAAAVKPTEPIKAETSPAPAPRRETLSAPRLTPKDIVALLREDDGLQFLLNQAQTILGRTISHSEQEMLINMVNYYGLRVEVVLMILEFYRSERERGRSIAFSYVVAMAKEWSEEGIDTLSDAEEKLRSIEKSDRLWSEIVAITGIKHRRPTAKQREMITEWFNDFDIQMLTLASDIMKENIPEPKLQYINTILKKWKKNGISSPAQVKAEQEQFARARADREGGRLKTENTYDIDTIKKNARNNTDI